MDPEFYHDLLIRIDERTRNTEALIRSHIDKDEKIQSQLLKYIIAIAVGILCINAGQIPALFTIVKTAFAGQ